MTDTKTLSRASRSAAEKEARDKRCKDCDHDCWDVPDKVVCWSHDPTQGLCPWLYPGLEYPPKAGR
jgi:hypothetical protein